MPELTKKHLIEDEVVTLTIQVQKRNVPRIREYLQAIENGEKETYTIAEVFPEFVGKPQEIGLRAYRTREGVTQKQLARLTGIPQRHISEMENGKRGIGKERARKLSKALNVSDFRLLL